MKLIDVSKRAVTLVLTLSIILTSFSFVAADTFSDIPDNHWAKDHIKYLSDNNLVNGVKDNTYNPNANITRAQFTTMINKALGLSDQTEVIDLEFEDVHIDDWYYEDVARAVEAGFVSGHSDNTFAPEDPVTREQAATIVVRAFDLGSASKKISFLDRSKISSWARSFVDVTSEQGYIVGFPDGNFKPELNITRAQSATIVYRLITGDVAEAPEPPAPKEEPKPNPAPAPVPKGQQIAAAARKYLGHRYVYGGTTPSGFDCSGFTQYVYRQFGVSLPRTSGAQRSAGKAVSRANIRPGDLLTFSGHVGIYVGDGVMVHAANPSRGVVTDNVFSGYYNGRVLSIRRLVD